MNDLVKGYIDFINNIDPYWEAYQEPEEVLEIELPEMLYNLEEILKNNELDKKDKENCKQLIGQFKKALNKSQIDTEEPISDKLLTCYELSYGMEVENMDNKQIAKMLRLHHINYFEENGRVYADNGGRMLYDRVIDLTGYSRLNLLAWLGY